MVVRKGYDNNLYYVCYLICDIAERTYRKSYDIIDILGYDKLKHYYDLADVYHCENPDKVCSELIEECNIKMGNFCRPVGIPTPSVMGKVYHNLIKDLYDEGWKGYTDIINLLIYVFESVVGKGLEEYKNCLYWQSPECIFDCFLRDTVDFD